MLTFNNYHMLTYNNVDQIFTFINCFKLLTYSNYFQTITNNNYYVNVHKLFTCRSRLLLNKGMFFCQCGLRINTEVCMNGTKCTC